SDLRTLVHAYDPDAGTFTEVLNFAGMTYDRGCGLEDVGTGTCFGDADWQVWQTTYPPTGLLTLSFIGGSREVSYPQPMLSDIEFGADDTMVLGFRDRFGDQTGFDERDPNDTEFIRGDGFGDILRATPNGSGQWVVSAVEASDGTEFFDEDDWTDTDFTHFETSFGGLAIRPGNGEVLYTRMDPIDGTALGVNDFSAGLHWSSLADGSENQAYELYDPDTPGLIGIFGKGNGLGDVELICEAPPLEVGNRVWCDDGDGVQDPGEPGLASVPVTFTCDTGGDGLLGNGADLTATTTTDASGLFLFNAANVTGGIPPRTLCQIRVNRAPLNGVCGAIADVTLADASSGAGSDLRDSDAEILFGDVVGIEFTTGALGENDHSLDLGFTPATTVDVAGNLVSLRGHKMAKAVRKLKTSLDPERPLFLVVNIFDAHDPYPAVPAG
ncbi:MAG: SdrD B-like domain-containing protein, partial [Acidobacteriota bacterium]